MSKLINTTLVLAMFSIFFVMPVFADSGCKTVKFSGSYTTVINSPDVWGDGSGVPHTFILQLNLNSDGTVSEQYTGALDIPLSSGTQSTSVGSWQCRADGKLVVTTINATYAPTNDAAIHGFLNVPADLLLFIHSRTTYLFSVPDENTLTRIQARTRRYAPAENPTDPNGGTLRPLNTTVVEYKRLIASDADLLAP